MDFETLHDFAAMTLDRLDAQVQTRGNVARAVTIGDELQNFGLTRRERSEGPSSGYRRLNGRNESVQLGLQDDVVCARAYQFDDPVMLYSASDYDEWSRGTHRSEKRQSCTRPKRRECMVGQHNLGSEARDRLDKIIFVINARNGRRERRALQFLTYELGIGLAVLEKQDAQRLGHSVRMGLQPRIISRVLWRVRQTIASATNLSHWVKP